MKQLLNLFCAFAFFSSATQAKEYFCYVPGAGGLNSFIGGEVSEKLNASGIPFETFAVGKLGTIEERSQKLVELFGALLERDPTAKCHLFGFSMGGVLIRYAANHLRLNEEDPTSAPFQDYVLTQTSASSPHRGTPLANYLRDTFPGVRPGLELLTREGMEKYNDPESQSYSPVIDGIPFYSYLTYVGSLDEIGSVLGQVGYQFIEHAMTLLGEDPTNDGVVPTSSMSFGEVLGSLNLPHEFLAGRFVDERIDVVEFLTEHWIFLTEE